MKLPDHFPQHQPSLVGPDLTFLDSAAAVLLHRQAQPCIPLKRAREDEVEAQRRPRSEESRGSALLLTSDVRCVMLNA